MKEDRLLGIDNLNDFMKFLKNEEIIFSKTGKAIYYCEELNMLILDKKNIPIYRKAPELTGARFVEDIKLLETMAERFIPIIDMDTREILFTYEDYLVYRKKMSGLKEYNTGNYIFSDNLYFDGLDYYLNLIDRNMREVKNHSDVVKNEFTRIMNEIGLSVTVGCNSGGDVELIEAGSTSRFTNVPTVGGDKKWDLDFTVRIDPSKTWKVKEALENGFIAGGHITRTSAYKVRLTDVVINGLDKPIDLDFSLTPQKEKYLSTEDALSERLNNMREQDEFKYRLVLANIMYAKDMLKKSGAYKPSRGILNGNREYGGLGGVGIENWILQYGGSLIDATTDFLVHAEGKEFIEFEKEYAIMDFGQDHVSTSKKEFPYHNFIMRNMRYKGFEIMRECLQQFKDQILKGKNPKK